MGNPESQTGRRARSGRGPIGRPQRLDPRAPPCSRWPRRFRLQPGGGPTMPTDRRTSAPVAVRRLRTEGHDLHLLAWTPTTTSNTGPRPPTAPVCRFPTRTPASPARGPGLADSSPAFSRTRPTTSGSSPTTRSRSPGISADRTFNTTETPTPPPPHGERTSAGGEGPAQQGQQGPAQDRDGQGQDGSSGHANGPHPLQPQRREEGQVHLHQSSGCLAIWKPLLVPSGGSVIGPVKLGSIKRPEGGSAGDLPGPAPLHVRRRHEARRSQRRRAQGRRHLARGQGAEAEALGDSPP